ncbi:MAG TPA: hypothetical protein VJB70_00820 [Candidatus Paceibacterota bacterium]
MNTTRYVLRNVFLFALLLLCLAVLLFGDIFEMRIKGFSELVMLCGLIGTGLSFIFLLISIGDSGDCNCEDDEDDDEDDEDDEASVEKQS